MSIVVITFFLAVLMIACGILLWKKQRIEMLKTRLRGNVTDIPGYTAAFGKTLILMGTLLILSGILGLLSFVPSWLSSLVFYAGVVISVGLLLVIQRKYNGAFLSK